ncbi:unnamed protein product [Clonostachys rosea]|uniref:Serine-threonine/tyrosine-protein kinase catalytic domain-containing protein n=1 Tax=Bionectria ochroleuca TaxID=29856 RepID=A0ABY6UQS6_BIOOC|nr:unnamed protein product [Clonostachys rosea]
MAELALGVVGLAGTVDACVKLGKYLVQACKDYSQSDAKLNELSLRMEICWLRISSQLEVMTHLERGMSAEQNSIQGRILLVLRSKLDDAVILISKPDKFASSRTAKKLYFLSLRDDLEKTVAELESWQERFKPTWFQLVKDAPLATIDGMHKNISVGNSRHATEPTLEAVKFRRAFEEEDRRPVFIAEKTLQSLYKRVIPYCSAQLAVEPNESKYHIIDTVSADIVNAKDARDLASRLRDSNPLNSGTLKCKGIVRQPKKSSMAFIFRVPDGYTNVRSLRELLLSGQPPESLTIRLEMARQLVNAVYFVHLYEFVHKNLSPETILSLEKEGERNATVCLVGFQVIRHAEAKTNTSKADRKEILYQHSARQGSESVDFIMQHDIYSLGVCLLEIGLWEPLITYGPDGTQQTSNIIGPEQNGSEKYTPSLVQKQLIALSRGKLRVIMGDRYSKVVETCLTCLDEGNTDFGDPKEFQDEDGIEVGARYVKKVMDIISEISF